jgi:hypothetical protein
MSDVEHWVDRSRSTGDSLATSADVSTSGRASPKRYNCVVRYAGEPAETVTLARSVSSRRPVPAADLSQPEGSRAMTRST